MSRIAGVIRLQFDKSTQEQLLNGMHHAPLEKYGVYENRDCLLLCRNITNKDPVQLVSLEWKGERYTIAFDGEIYNLDEVKKELIGAGIAPCHLIDANIVLNAYLLWGEEVVDRLLGAFAFVIWHENEQRLFMARDQMGIRPLFYGLHNNGFIFGSEIKSILHYPTFEAELDSYGVAQILLIGPGRIPGSGVFKNVYELEPGHSAIYHNGMLTKRRYWSLKDRIHTDNFEDTAAYIRDLVKESVLIELEENAGTFLSGGLDSSIITALCAQQHSRDLPLKTFSVDYVNNDVNFVPGKYQPEADGHYIEIMRKFTESDHHQIMLDSDDLMSSIEVATLARDLPGMGDVDCSLLAFSKRIKECSPVALSGECADEIFGGYPWFREPELLRGEGFPWAQNTEYRASFINKSYSIRAKEFVMDHFNTSIAQCDVLPDNTSEDRVVKQMTWLNQKWFMQTLIDRNDRMSIFSGLKIRAPFCNHKIAEYLYAVPWQYKNYGNREKGLLRYAMQGIVPDEILWRKKSPYPKTYDPQYTLGVMARLRDLMADLQAPVWAIVDYDAVKLLMQQEHENPWYGQLMKRPQTIAYILQIDFWLRAYKISLN